MKISQSTHNDRVQKGKVADVLIICQSQGPVHDDQGVSELDERLISDAVFDDPNAWVEAILLKDLELFEMVRGTLPKLLKVAQKLDQ